MSAEPPFQDLMRRIRAGDSAAATELVRQYEPEIRRTVRVRLTDPRLHRVLDSVDICQSVLANFFTRAALGQFDLEQPEQLLKLLVTMARNKLNDYVRKEQADRRDNRRLAGGGDEALAGVADSIGTPSQVVSGKELLEEARRQLSPDERYLADQRVLGREWADLARELNATPDALRIKLARAMDRVAEKLSIG